MFTTKSSEGWRRFPTRWRGGTGGSSEAVQPQHPGASRWLPINPFHAFSPLPIAQLPVHTRELKLSHLSRASPDPDKVPPRCPQWQGAVGCGVAADCPDICFVTSAGVDFHAFALPFSPGWFLLCLQFFPSSPTFLLSICSAPLLLGCHPSFSPPPHSQSLENLLKALPVFQVRKNFYEVSALFFH